VAVVLGLLLSAAVLWGSSARPGSAASATSAVTLRVFVPGSSLGWDSASRGACRDESGAGGCVTSPTRWSVTTEAQGERPLAVVANAPPGRYWVRYGASGLATHGQVTLIASN
jgi:hypothetical protein